MKSDHDDKGTNETNETAELSSWRGEWQALGGQEDLAAQLVARAAKDGRRMRRAASAEVLGATFSTSICLWLLVRTHGALEVVVVTALILLFNGGWLTHFFMPRADLLRSTGKVSSLRQLTRRRLATELRWARMPRAAGRSRSAVRWSHRGASGSLVAHRDAYLAAPWRAILGFGGGAAIFAGVYVWTHRKERKLRRRVRGVRAPRRGRQLA